MKYLIFCFTLVLMLTPGAGFTKDDSAVVARGEGIAVDEGFVGLVAEYYQKQGFTAPKEQQVRAATRIMLFAQAALDSGIVDELPAEVLTPEEVSGLVRINNIYISQQMRDYPVSQEAIESYYRSYPDRFTSNSPGKINPFRSTFSEPVDQEKIISLDQELQERIRFTIVKAKEKQISNELFDKLSAEYEIEYLR